MERDAYCPHMGTIVQFPYCMSMNEGLPCRNIVRCWESRMDIVTMLEERFTREELHKTFGGVPKSRIDRIVEGIPKG